MLEQGVWLSVVVCMSIYLYKQSGCEAAPVLTWHLLASGTTCAANLIRDQRQLDRLRGLAFIVCRMPDIALYIGFFMLSLVLHPSTKTLPRASWGYLVIVRWVLC